MNTLNDLIARFPLRFQFPELFLLAIPLWFVYRRWGRAEGMTGWLRLTMLALLLLVLTGPQLRLGGRGIDIIVVADRSRSMPEGSAARIRELITNLQTGRGPGDRVGLVTFGLQAAVEQQLSREAVVSEYQKEVLPDGSDLNDALHTALNLVDQTRPARILVFSDGESNGSPPESAARRALELQVPIDYREFERARVGDIAVETLLLPEEVAPREPFQFSVWVYADTEQEAVVNVYREAVKIGSQSRLLRVGSNQFLFRDLLELGGLYNYEVRLEVEHDPLRENNRGAGVVRVDAGSRLLVLNSDGAKDNLVRALEAGRVPIDVASVETHPLSQDSLDPYRAVILENVAASKLGRLKMERLAQFVEDLGGGLLLTGGERSFGTGGYFKSPLDEVLPVSMEMREEHRKTRMALAIALDRSGSMMAPVSGGKVKMDLANLGTAECIRLLSPGDSVAVIAVDSSPHVIQSLIQVDDPEPIVSKVLKIESMGGGIFVYEALVAAGNELLDAEQATKHIILFSDAQDSEEPGDYKNLLAQYAAAGITVSVIGLGTDKDVDAALLKDVALLGKGNIMFTEDAEELPRLFTQDTMSIARSSFIKKEDEQVGGIPGQLLADIRLMGDFGAEAFPPTDGYNLSYLKPEATLGVVSQDEYAAPWSAFWYRGLGRSAAITLEVDGQYSGAFGKWPDYSDFLVTHGRWLLGGANPSDIYINVAREGQDAVVTLEIDPDRPSRAEIEAPTLIVVPPGDERQPTIDVPFEWQGANLLQARFRLAQAGTYRPLVNLGGRSFLRGPAVTLPYSPEFMPRIGLPTGPEELKTLAEMTHGKQRLDPRELLADPPRSASVQSLAPWLFLAVLCLLVVEIAGRRLSLWEKLTEAVTPEPVPQAIGPPLRQTAPPRRGPDLRPTRTAPTTAAAAAPPAAAPPATPTADDAFLRAKQRAKRKM